MAKKKRKTYTADELRQLKLRLDDHRIALCERIVNCTKLYQDDRFRDDRECDPIAIRDKCQELVETDIALSRIADSIALAGQTGAESLTFNLGDCGLDDQLEVKTL